MKKKSILICVVSLLLTGCSGPAANPQPVRINIEGGGEFPSYLAGTWRAEEQKLEMVVKPDGTIASATVGMGRMKLEPGKTKKVPLIYKGKGVYSPGEWFATYNPVTRYLIVQLSLKHFAAKIGDNLVEGQTSDTFTGTITPDGKSWLVDWTTYANCKAHAESQKEFVLEGDPDGETTTAVFIKTEPK